MANITIIGAGICGMLTGTLLARDGHDVTVLERDPAAPLGSAEAAWEGWERRGVSQFRLLHYLQPRFRQEAERELPELLSEMDELGAIRYGLDRTLEQFTGGVRPGDDAFVSVTGRRPVIETAVARVAAATRGITVRRGAAVAALLTAPGSTAAIPHVTGVRLETGQEVLADLVIDAGGRRSAIDRLLEDAGACTTACEQDDLGLVYYGRHFRCPDGVVPDLHGPILAGLGTISTLTLPADNGTCGLGLLAMGSDKALRKLKDPAAWERVWRSVPHVAHWLEGTPIDEGVAVMANVPDRIRTYVVDGAPVATGVTSVADAWSCTNPSVGRGITIGLLHALCLRDTLAATGLADPETFALAFDSAASAEVEPWYRATVELDRARLTEMASLLADAPPAPEDPDPQGQMRAAFVNGAWHDPDLMRGLAAIGSMLATPEEVLARPGYFDKVLAQGDADFPFTAPSRKELLELVA